MEKKSNEIQTRLYQITSNKINFPKHIHTPSTVKRMLKNAQTETNKAKAFLLSINGGSGVKICVVIVSIELAVVLAMRLMYDFVGFEERR